MTYFGLYALQHRGQESAGIVTWDGENIREQKGMGLVADVFNERHLGKELKGEIAMGHIRYSTTGASLIRNAQPFLVRHGDLRLAVAHNGNLVNTYELRAELEQNGSIFQTTMDTEVFAHLVIKYLHETDTIEAAIAKACSRVRGAYSMLIMANDKLIAVKDPNGVRPLGLGRVGDRYVIATETCAFDLIEAEYLRPLEPGEIVTIHKNKLTSFRFNDTEPKRQCIFELIYFARPDSNIFGDVVYERRKAMGVMLAKEAPVDADFVMPFPDSGNYAAVGYSQESGLPLELAMIRNHYVGRTFIQPSQGHARFFGAGEAQPGQEHGPGQADHHHRGFHRARHHHPRPRAQAARVGRARDTSARQLSGHQVPLFLRHRLFVQGRADSGQPLGGGHRPVHGA